MYSLVLMSAMAGSPDALAFGKRNGCDGGCHGAVAAGCNGGRRGLFGRHKHAADNNCGCCGVTPVAPPPCDACPPGVVPMPLNPQPIPPRAMPPVPGSTTPTPTPGSTTPTPNPGTTPKATTPNPGSTPPKKVTPTNPESALPPPAAPAPRPARVD